MNPVYGTWSIVVYQMEFDKTRWPWNSDQNCTQNSARGVVGGGPGGWVGIGLQGVVGPRGVGWLGVSVLFEIDPLYMT